MNAAYDPFGTLHSFLRQADHARWQRLQSKRQILRSQLGFTDLTSSRPKACQGCSNYHGVAYGYSRETRTALICGFHPYGWEADSPCPDWCGAS